jgi:hypothetical protein
MVSRYKRGSEEARATLAEVVKIEKGNSLSDVVGVSSASDAMNPGRRTLHFRY